VDFAPARAPRVLKRAPGDETLTYVLLLPAGPSMRQQCGGPATIHRRESENQAVAGSPFCHQIGTPASLLE